MGFRVQGLGFGVEGLGLRGWFASLGSFKGGSDVWALGISRVEGLYKGSLLSASPAWGGGGGAFAGGV